MDFWLSQIEDLQCGLLFSRLWRGGRRRGRRRGRRSKLEKVLQILHLKTKEVTLHHAMLDID
jgi:hypothetical protein